MNHRMITTTQINTTCLFYFKENMLPEASLWRRLLFCNYSEYGVEYERLLDIDVRPGRNILTNNSSNATAENYFKFVKSNADLIKTPIFIERMSEKIDELQIEVINGILEGFSSKKHLSGKFTKRDISAFLSLIKDNDGDIDEATFSRCYYGNRNLDEGRKAC